MVARAGEKSAFHIGGKGLWPESIAAVGVGGETSMLARSLGRLASFLYRSSSHVVVVTPAFKEQLVQKWKVDPDKISVVENGVEAIFSSSNGNSETAQKINSTSKEDSLFPTSALWVMPVGSV